MAEKKPKIIIVKEDFTATQVAEESVSKVVKSAEVMDAVDMMATDFEPDESTVLSNEEFSLVFASLTDVEANKLMGKAGVEAVEDDDWAYASQDLDEPDGEGRFDDEFIEQDEEASLEIDEALSEFEFLSEEDLDLMTPSSEDAALAAQFESDFDEMEIDDNGEIVTLNEPAARQAEAAGIPRDKLLPLIRCVISCAIKETSGRVQDVSDEKIGELLASFSLEGSSAAVRACRDYITCGLKIIYAPQTWRYSMGTGVRVAVVDTGITPRHPDLRVYGGASFVPGVPSWHDDHYHGTHVAGSIAALRNCRGVVGVAPRARLYAVKVLNRRGSGRTSWILNGLAWCYRHHMHVVNLSLGSGASTHDPRVYSRAYEAAGRRLRRRCILPIAAAGNSGGTRSPYVGNPARCPSFMAVGAIDCRRRRAPFSSYGPQVEICAPGDKVWSTFPPNRYRQLSGTSMAAPHIAGVAALVKRRHPSWCGDRIRVHLMRTALDLGRPGRDWFYGNGQVRAFHAVR